MNLTEYQNYHETKAHTLPDFPYNTYLCSIPLDFIQVPPHWHEEVELIVIKKGQGIVSVDFHSKIVSAGDIVLVRPGQLHAIRQNAFCEMEYENIIFKISLLVSDSQEFCAKEFLLPLFQGESASDTFLTPSCPSHSDMLCCINRIDELCDTRPRGYQLAVKGCLFQFFFSLLANEKKGDPASKVKTKSLEKLKMTLKYVEEHYPEAIRIDDVAALTFYSKSHFMKFFKEHMGMGFIEYLNDYRLTMAARMLVTETLPVLEIAADSGFENLSYFNRLFKRKYGQTPGEYRKAFDCMSAH